MDESEVLRFEQQKQIMKLSQAIRECGYGNHMDYDDCVLGRAYKRVFGSHLGEDGLSTDYGPEGSVCNRYVKCAARKFGVPVNLAQQAEFDCFSHMKPEAIADKLEALGY